MRAWAVAATVAMGVACGKNTAGPGDAGVSASVSPDAGAESGADARRRRRPGRGLRRRRPLPRRHGVRRDHLLPRRRAALPRHGARGDRTTSRFATPSRTSSGAAPRSTSSPRASIATSTRTRRAPTRSGCSTGTRRRPPASRRASASARPASGPPRARARSTRRFPTAGSATTTSATWTTSTSTRASRRRRRSSSSIRRTPTIAFKELSRLDESVPSGSMETCKSGFGVYDMPGNVDEWVVNDGRPHEKSKYAGAQGGRVGARAQPVPTRRRSATSPSSRTTSSGSAAARTPQGVSPDEKWAPSPQAVPPPPVEPHDFAPEPLVPVDPPGPSKTKYARTGHRE